MRTIFGTFPDKTIEELTAEARKPEEVEWLEFKGRQHHRFASKEPRITINKRGMFYLNHPAFLALGEPLAVELIMEKMRRVIGMKSADPLRENVFDVKQHGTGNYKRISASAFCQHFRLYTGGTLLFNNIRFDDEGVLRLDLVSATKVGRGAR